MGALKKMNVLFVHRNFPAQFGHIAEALIRTKGFHCTFLSEKANSGQSRVTRIQYRTQASEARSGVIKAASEYFTRSFDVYKQLADTRWERPDLIVSHSGFGSTLFLRDLYDCPIVHLCEWFYWKNGSDGEFLSSSLAEVDSHQPSILVRNATLLADLERCTLGYSPTNWQRSRFPHQYQYKLETIFDGIDTDVWRPQQFPAQGTRTIAGKHIAAGKKVVTYVSRGFESIRGFDVFMRIAARICEKRDDVVFLCIGTDQVCYGADAKRISENTYREHIWNKGRFDANRFIFTGGIPASELAKAFSLSDLHCYLTAPFVLSWSLMDALACGCTVLASDTPPLREVIRHGQNGLLAPYWDVERFAELACQVLDDPMEYRRRLGNSALETIQTSYSLERVLPRMLSLYERAINGPAAQPRSHIVRTTVDDTSRHITEKARPLRYWLCDWLKLLRDSMLAAPPDPEGFGSSPVNDWLSENSKETLLQMMPSSAATILEFGSFRGETTRWLAERFTNAKIVAVDEWSGANFPQASHLNWKLLMPQIWRGFSANVRQFRGRVLAWKDRHDLAPARLHRLGIKPDVILIHPEYDTTCVRKLLCSLAENYSRQSWIGLNWHWPVLQDLLTQLSKELERKLSVCDSVWRLDPARAILTSTQSPSNMGRTSSCEYLSPSPTITDHKNPRCTHLVEFHATKG